MLFRFRLFEAPRKKTLLLDLDETLIHSCNLKENPQHILTAINEFGEKISVTSCFFKILKEKKNC